MAVKELAGEMSIVRSQPRVVHIVTASMTTRLMRRQLQYLREAGFEVTIVSAPGKELEAVAQQEGVKWAAVPMEREISPLKDILSLWLLWRLLRQLRPAVVNVGTAKAGLLAGIAARLAGVPCRIYTLHGIRLETTRGIKRWLLTWTERISCACANRVLCVSDSVRRLALELSLTEAKRAAVLAAGSFNGVEASRFAPTPERLARARELKRELGFPEHAPVIGFVGRLVRDKGVPELLEAFEQVRRRFPETRLLLLGRFETGDPVPERTRQLILSDPAIVHVGYVSDPSIHYQVMDMLALPTHREGFPTVVLEAAAAGKPVVAARATGAVDAVVDGVTGLLVPVGDAKALAEALGELIAAPEVAVRMGKAGRERVEREFPTERLCRALAELYCTLLSAQGLPNPAQSDFENKRLPSRFSKTSRAIKRISDIGGATVGLALTGPLMGLAAICILIAMGPPVLFKQRRAGLHGRTFQLLKLRTMSNERDAQGRLLPDGQRTNQLGRVLRRFSIDELPQLWNVLKGDMSLVGPRPLLPEYLPLYTEREQLRHTVRPGLTGCSQVNGRHTLLFSRRLELDSWYVEHWSLPLDIRLFVRTIPKLVSSDSVACQDLSVDDRQFWRHVPEFAEMWGNSLQVSDRIGNRGSG